MLPGIAKLLGLEPEDARSEFRYRPTREDVSSVDRLGHIRIVRRHMRTANEWEARQAVLWSASIEAIASAAGLTFSKIASGLRQHGPFTCRYDRTGHHVW